MMFEVQVQLLGDPLKPLGAGLTQGSLYLPRQPTYLFDRLEPLFTQHIGLTPAGWHDAWETTELVRAVVAYRTRTQDSINDALDRITRASKTSTEAEAAAFEDDTRRLSEAASVQQLHIRVRDDRGDDSYYPLVGRRLEHALALRGEDSPLVRENILGRTALEARVTLRALSLAIAKQGESVAWRGVHAQGAGTIPDYIWLDTGDIPERDV